MIIVSCSSSVKKKEIKVARKSFTNAKLTLCFSCFSELFGFSALPSLSVVLLPNLSIGAVQGLPEKNCSQDWREKKKTLTNESTKWNMQDIWWLIFRYVKAHNWMLGLLNSSSLRFINRCSLLTLRDMEDTFKGSTKLWTSAFAEHYLMHNVTQDGL